ncbi:trypco2 family protein [Streptomyces lancefieldiae]|uniref:Trypco2 family protein n=1 Tax=Streptomyces lancefieldiae TaxID=3075520 RepID=A0ABU3AQ17_9ACTN|nr:trypco2 family protein [Streptomyces sp. DSM 40712]MDT0612029.1 trypco2 family protein [Streptomyces sp. DSM 40712]
MTCAQNDGGDWLDLADAVGLLRDQILEARRRAGTSEVRFEIDNVTVEFELELARSRAAGGELRFGVVGVNGKGESSERKTHRVSLALLPRTGGGPVEIRDIDDV